MMNKGPDTLRSPVRVTYFLVMSVAVNLLLDARVILFIMPPTYGLNFKHPRNRGYMQLPSGQVTNPNKNLRTA